MEELMKPIITGFLDFDGKSTFAEQIELATKLQLNYICLRKYNQRPLIEIDDKEIKTLLSTLKETKLKIAIIDTNIDSYDINDDKKHSNALDEFNNMIRLADRLKVQYLYYRLPQFNNVINEYDNIKKRLEPFVEAAMKSNKKMILLPTNNYKANVYAFILKKINSNALSVAFDPVYLMENDESTTTAYRLLKNKIGSFSATDGDHQKSPKLIGYGKTEIVSIFKKLIRDRYDGFFMIDNKFHDEVFKELPPKKGIFSKLFKNKNKKKETILSDLSSKIFPREETKNVTMDDIFENQIKVIKIIFR